MEKIKKQDAHIWIDFQGVSWINLKLGDLFNLMSGKTISLNINE